MKTNSGFDFLAPVYDSLARFVFGRNIVDSQIWFLKEIPQGSKVLVLGGGTGWLLEELQKRNSSCTVWYIEVSQKMIERSRHRQLKNNVHFIHGTEEAIPVGQKFDVVITNFYLDLFSEKTLSNVIQRISSHTSASSIWLVTDFINGGKWWHTFMLKVMYGFFKLVCRIEANHLPEWPSKLSKQEWKEVNSRLWYSHFIKSSIWNHPRGHQIN